jgi:hypothetical protein
MTEPEFYQHIQTWIEEQIRLTEKMKPILPKTEKLDGIIEGLRDVLEYVTHQAPDQSDHPHYTSEQFTALYLDLLQQGYRREMWAQEGIELPPGWIDEDAITDEVGMAAQDWADEIMSTHYHVQPVWIPDDPHTLAGSGRWWFNAIF